MTPQAEANPNMKYWLIRSQLHETEIQQGLREHTFDRIVVNESLERGDAVYIAGTYGDLYACGTVHTVTLYQDEDSAQQRMKVDVAFLAIGKHLLSSELLSKSPELARPFAKTDTNLIRLRVEEASSFNGLLRGVAAKTPPDPLAALIFILGQPVRLEEARDTEFKEITSQNPVDVIKNAADEYAVAFLNKGKLGGSIFWGIRDSREVVGTRFNYAQRDEIRRQVSNKIGQIQPRIPLSSFHLDFHAVQNADGQEINDLWVCELNIYGGLSTHLYATGSGDVFIKTDGGKKKLDHMQKVVEILRRNDVGGNHEAKLEENGMFAIVTWLTQCAQSNAGNVWAPTPGSYEHRLAEKMVQQGRLMRVPGVPGNYALPGSITIQ